MTETGTRRIFVSPRAKSLAAMHDVSLNRVEGTGPYRRIIEQDVRSYIEQNKRGVKETPGTTSIPYAQKALATSLAKAIAKAENIDLNVLSGSGMNGKIVRSDVLHAKKESASESVETGGNPSAGATPISGIRKIIAERMSLSKQTAPHVTLTVKVEATRLTEVRNRWKQDGINLSYTDILVKIVAHSLQENPRVNVSLDQNRMVKHQDCHIGVAVALEEGLVVPVIRDADRKSLQDISKDLKDKVTRAKLGKLQSEDMRDGRFTISNLGMFDVDAFTPIINLPESAILGVGRIVEDLIVHNGQIHIGKTMVLSLSFDHRVMDGAPAASFLTSIKELLENPEFLRNLYRRSDDEKGYFGS